VRQDGEIQVGLCLFSAVFAFRNPGLRLTMPKTSPTGSLFGSWGFIAHSLFMTFWYEFRVIDSARRCDAMLSELSVRLLCDLQSANLGIVARIANDLFASRFVAGSYASDQAMLLFPEK
jgi:hypothetical protein